MDHPVSKSDLEPAEQHLVELLQKLNFGRIENLQIRNGKPVLEPPPRQIATLKMGSNNGPRGEVNLEDFWLKQPLVELFELTRSIGDGTIQSIDVKHGLPLIVEVERRA